MHSNVIRPLLLAASLAAVPGGLALAGSSASAADYGAPDVCARVKRGLQPSLGTGSYVSRYDDERVRAFVGGFDGGLVDAEPDLRGLRRDGRLAGLTLCNVNRTVARLPLPTSRRARVVAVSVNGRRVAWRTIAGARGTLSVGIVRGRAVRAVRSTTTRALYGTGPIQKVEGQLLVTPDGSVAWSLPVGRQAGVWLWPRGQRPRRVAVTARDKVTGHASRDVRIVDRYSVLIGSGTEIARYRPPTPGRCPTGIGVRSAQVGPFDVRYSPGAFTEQESESAGWSHVLVCDPAVGDYVRVLPFSSYSSGFTGSGSHGGSSTPTRVAFTAGTLVIEQAINRSGGGDSYTEYGALIVPRDAADAIRTATGGRLAGPEAAPVSPAEPVGPGAHVGIRVVPGAVAWTEEGTGLWERTVWLADAAGRRAVGTATQRSFLARNGLLQLRDAALTLDAGELTWNTADGTGRSPVVPTADPVLETGTLTG